MHPHREISSVVQGNSADRSAAKAYLVGGGIGCLLPGVSVIPSSAARHQEHKMTRETLIGTCALRQLGFQRQSGVPARGQAGSTAVGGGQALTAGKTAGSCSHVGDRSQGNYPTQGERP